MGDFDAAVGVAMRAQRDRMGLTILDLVERSGLPGSDLEAWEAGATIPRASLRPVASALGLSLPSFLARVHPRPADEEVSLATPVEGVRLLQHFLQISDAASRRFLIDMARAIGDDGFNPGAAATPRSRARPC